MAPSSKEFDCGESYPRPSQGIERVSFLRRSVWHNAGFGSLRRIRAHIAAVEPRFVPTVYPHDVPGLPSRPEEAAAADPAPTGSDATNEEDWVLDPILAHCSVAQFRKAYLTGDLTPLAVVKALLPLIRRDISPPGIHSTAWIDVKVDLVLQAAEVSTLRYRNKRSLGPLDGVPAAVKDQYDVESYVTTLGSPHDFTGREGDKTYTSWCVQKLQDAGAIIVGKLNMHEFAADTSGINTTYGTPRNPYNKGYYTGGSSSGSAYAVAAGLVPIALGTDGGGSIRIPASFCSVYGLKPSHGRLSYLPGVNQNSTCEVNGPIAIDMGSLATPAASHIGVPASPSLHDMLLLSPSGLATTATTSNTPRVLGVPEAWFDRAEPAVQDLCRSMIDWLVKNKDYTVVPIEIPFLVEGETAHALTVLSHTATAIPEETHAASTASPAVRIMLALGRETGAGDYILAQKLRQVLMQHLAWLWRERHPGMLIVTPATAGAGWPIRHPAREMGRGLSDGRRSLQTMEYVWLANFCGMPSLSVPAGYVVAEGGRVPVGLMATAEWTREDLLMRFGCDTEGLTAERYTRPESWIDLLRAAQGAHLEGS
ncbi:glutamyl-tRNA(Gln) amidotransferase subunit A [Apiospora hydei]|uniref:Glutamyl-tRNA(Gln) amidotransferase subunit A n=1 Tax=Apiospora hydei TaxID=1337664 RepID=A0ABR1WP34_9PEZI